MRTSCFTNRAPYLAAAFTLAVVSLVPLQASAATLNLDGIPESGAPAFIFEDSVTTGGGGGGSFANNIKSWFTNYTVVRNTDDDGLNFNTRNEGDFTFLGSLTNDYADVNAYEGVSGIFDLSAQFASDGSLLGGDVTITGAVAALGLNDPDSFLMSGKLVDYDWEGNLFGFSIDNIQCNAVITFCATSADQLESIYFQLDQELTGAGSLRELGFRSSLSSTTTVPVPAAAWLMLSGLGWMGVIGVNRRKAQQ
jgi:hypothetical protein